ncbi:hypothetical protein [Halalkalibacter flavus]|uniref:hypothetical protein n=1 Tax=Halalkalibacter flavus TaxID=3090668 RepID=UPI002FC9498D
MDQPLYKVSTRFPKKGDWVQCMLTRQIWSILLVCDNDNVIVGYLENEKGITEGIYLESKFYNVLEKVRDEDELPF